MLLTTLGAASPETVSETMTPAFHPGSRAGSTPVVTEEKASMFSAPATVLGKAGATPLFSPRLTGVAPATKTNCPPTAAIYVPLVASRRDRPRRASSTGVRPQRRRLGGLGEERAQLFGRGVAHHKHLADTARQDQRDRAVAHL